MTSWRDGAATGQLNPSVPRWALWSGVSGLDPSPAILGARTVDKPGSLWCPTSYKPHETRRLSRNGLCGNPAHTLRGICITDSKGLRRECCLRKPGCSARAAGGIPARFIVAPRKEVDMSQYFANSKAAWGLCPGDLSSAWPASKDPARLSQGNSDYFAQWMEIKSEY